MLTRVGPSALVRALEGMGPALREAAGDAPPDAAGDAPPDAAGIIEASSR